MKGLTWLIILVTGVVAAAFVIEAAAVGGAWLLHRQGQYDDEIRWLEQAKPVLAWERNLDRQLDRLYRERIERAIRAGRLVEAVKALRLARARSKSLGMEPGRELTALGIETFTRVADYVEQRGQLSRAADWDDSLFVLAVRAEDPSYRYAAVAAFMEGLDLRVRDGRPCAALARIEWAKRGLGGEIPGLQPSLEEDLVIQCEQSRGGARRK